MLKMFCHGQAALTLLAAVGIWSTLQIVSVAGMINFSAERQSHAFNPLSVTKQKRLANTSKRGFRRKFQPLVQPLLIERVAGSPGNIQAQQYIKLWMQDRLRWTVVEDSFQDSTPLGTKQFTNIIATKDPSARRFLVLACHFDSKLFEGFTFIGATDSAVPCAMMIDIARTLNDKLNNPGRGAEGVSLQFIFFDGEEAFRVWSATDSTYGSRHLAERWENTPHPQDQSSTVLEGMDALVLLDLIGAANPQFPNFFPQTTGRMHQQLRTIEAQLHRARSLRRHRPANQYFVSGGNAGGVQDDHIPFLNRGVPILHLISVPFPSVWHTASDNATAIHYQTVNNLGMILRVFVAEYLHLPV